MCKVRTQVRTLRAFTLIELLVVIVIIGILATISVAQFNSYQERARFARAKAFASQAEKLLLASVTSNESSPLARYLFDGDDEDSIQDISNNNHDFLITGNTDINLSNFTPTGSGKSLYINNAFIEKLSTKPLSNKVTIMGWVYWEEDQGIAIPFRLRDSMTSTHIYFSETNAVEFNYRYESSVHVWSKQNTAETGKWHHFLGTTDGTKSRLYIDGKLIAAKATSTAVGPQVGNIYISLGYSNAFKGYLDDVEFFDVVLPDEL